MKPDINEYIDVFWENFKRDIPEDVDWQKEVPKMLKSIVPVLVKRFTDYYQFVQ